MTDPRFQRVKEHLAQARDRGAEERRAYLEALRAEDAELHAEVTSLLGLDGGGPSLIATGALAEGLDAAAAAVAPVPERVGPYRLIEVLGEGGMGVVCRAEQDAPLRREVAVKLLRSAGDTGRVVARFETERQALALMDHPGIARVLDAGVDASGRPYFAMELVHGTRITAYCDAHRLDVRQRLELFLGVCDAVQHAHQRGVVHRDLKPANILVAEMDGPPAVKIVDFGIAKVLVGPPGGLPEVTQDGQILGTPEYMSPEQGGAPGASVDVRTDVYSLGVVLYELLTGGRPYRLETPRPRDVRRVVFQAEPVRPSSRAARLEPQTPLAAAHGGAEGVRRQLAGDLDLILLRALRREPDRRYASAEDLAADLRRLLAGRPVSARPDTLEYRTRKYLGRHRLGVAATTAIAALSISFAALTAVQLARVGRERERTLEAERLARVEADRAYMAAATATEVSRLVARVVQESAPGASHGRTLTPREILDRVAERTESQPGGEPAVQARMLTLLGGIYHGLGALDRSRALFERALEIRRDLPAGSRRELARTLAGLASVAHDQQRYEEAERLFRQALAVRREVSRGRGEEVAEDLNRLALTLEARGRPEEAEPLRRDALELRRQAGDLPALGAPHRAP